jgi:lysophospholipase L1-like esterase
MYFDIRVEYEFTGSTGVGLFLGDSITAGYGNGDVMSGTHPATLPHESWPLAAGLMGSFCAINGGLSSGSTGHFLASTAAAFTRFDLATTVPDFAVISLGTNDLGATHTSIQTNFMTIIDILRSLGIQKIFLTTILPRSYTQYTGTLQAATIAGATSISSSYSPGNVSIQVGSGALQEMVRAGYARMARLAASLGNTL